MVITEEFKKAIIEEINTDADFGFRLFQALIHSAGDQIVTTSYLDRALARLADEFDAKLARLAEDFDKKLAQQSVHFDGKLTQQSAHFEEKLAQQSVHFDGKLTQQSAHFEEKLAQQSAHFDGKLAQQTQDLKDHIDRKLGRIGSRWGINVEETFRRFAEEVVAQWGGTVTKWRRKLTMTDEYGKVSKQPYEVDMVIANGKIMLIEMKAHCDLDDLELFLLNAEQYVYVEKPSQPVEKVMLTFDISDPARDEAERAGMTIILPDD